jgi:type IV secretion/conjugal transfer VirB4 family ATPase
MHLTEHRARAKGLADLLLYDSLVDDGVLLLQDGALLAAWSFRGPDMASATNAEMAALSARLNSTLKLGTGWMIQCDAIRSRAPEYPDGGGFPDPVTRLIDDERRQQFSAEGAHFESEYFLSLTYLPPAQTEERVKGWMFDGASHLKSPAQRALDFFRSRIDAFADIFGSLFEVERLRARHVADTVEHPLVNDDLLRYVHRCITTVDHPVARPAIPSYLHDVLATKDFLGGMAPRVGSKRLRIIAIDGFPRLSFPGILGALDNLPIEYRWHTRAILLDPEEARGLLDKTRRKWRSKIRGWKDQLLRIETGPVNLFEQEMAADAEEAMGVASSGDVQFCVYNTVIVCAEESEARLDDAAGLVVKTVQNLGFACRTETVNAVEAWRGSLPGDGYRNVRRVILHTLNLADLMPITAVWAGPKQNPSPLMPPNSPPLLYAATTGATPFRFNLHVGDLGHALMIGPPGAGKSTFLGLVAAQWFRYPRAQVFAFDKGYSLFALTQAAGGEFYDIGGEWTDWAFCPLKEIDSQADVAWAVDWLESLCTLQDFKIAPRERNALGEAVTLLQSSPTRTLTELCANVQDTEVRQALHYYTLGGTMGHLLDADKDMLGNGRFLTFETEHLMNMGEKAVVGVLLYLFRRIEKRLDGSPTLVPLDEAWVYLRHALFRERVREWLKTLRKLNGAVLLSTQNLSDIFNSPIRDVVLESCPTKVLLPNAEAANPASRHFYESIGLNEREISIVQTSIPKRQYYVVSPAGRRLIALGLGGVGLSFVGVNSREERQAIEETITKYGEDWPSAWLRTRGLEDWADYLDEQLVLEGGRQ